MSPAKELEKRGLQIFGRYGDGEPFDRLGLLAGTKDCSMPGEFGQVSSYCKRIKMVLPSANSGGERDRPAGIDADAAMQLRHVRGGDGSDLPHPQIAPIGGISRDVPVKDFVKRCRSYGRGTP